MKSRLIVVTALSLALVAVLLFALAGNAPASVAQPSNLFKPVISRDVAHDTSAPLRDLAKLSLPESDRPSAIDAINKRIPNRFDDPKFLAELEGTRH